MSQSRSIRDFFSAVSSQKKTVHDSDDASDGDEIVVASRTITTAETQSSNRKTKRHVRPQSSTSKTGSHNTAARSGNEGGLWAQNDRPTGLSSRTSSTPIRKSNRPCTIGQTSSGIAVNVGAPSRSLVQSPVMLPLRSPRSASAGSRTKPSDRPPLDRDPMSPITTSESELSEGSRKGRHGQLLGKRVLTAVKIPPLTGKGNGKNEDLAQKSSSQDSSFGDIPDPMELETVSFSTTLGTSRSLVSTQSSSRRIVKNGLQAVTNSDSEDSDSSSDEGLGDVSIFVPYKRRRSSQPGENPSPRRSDRLSKSARKISRVAKPEAGGSRRRPSTVSPPQAVYKYSLASMVAQIQTSKQAEERITSLENEIAEAKTTEKTRNIDFEVDEVDSQALVAATEYDSDERERMLQALSRAEALKEERGYHFFLDHIPLFENSPFPVVSPPYDIWHDVLADDRLRAQACVTGLVTDMAARHPLPMEATLWMAQQLAHERSDTLCEAYAQVLCASLQHETSISDTMGRLSCFYRTRSFSESLWKDSESSRLPRGLSRLVRVVSLVAPASDARITDAPPSDTSAAVLDFACMLIDKRIKDDVGLSMTIVQSVENMLEALPEKSFDMLVSDVNKTLFEADEMAPRNRYHLITSFPVSTRRTYKLRRSLALTCFAPENTSAKHKVQNDWTRTVITAFQTRPEFAISESTDYDLLKALIEVLDIAIGPGFSDLSKPSSNAAQPSPSVSNPTAISSAAETLHNKQADALALHLQAMASRIRDAGANFLPRTEAKTAIERVVLRLQHSVRTQPKRWKSVFGSGSATQTGLNGFFSPVDRGMKAGSG